MNEEPIVMVWMMGGVDERPSDGVDEGPSDGVDERPSDGRESVEPKLRQPLS